MICPFGPVPMLLVSPPDSELLSLLQEADLLARLEPRIVASIEADLDHHGKVKKAFRMQDTDWKQGHSEGLPTVDYSPLEIDVDKLRLGIGRRRTPGYLVYMFLVGRGYYGGFKSLDAMTLLAESTTMAVFLNNCGEKMPAASTLNELVSAVSNRSRTFMFDAQIRRAIDDGFDDCSTLLLDSTGTYANTVFPNDSNLMVRLLARLLHRGEKLALFELPAIHIARADKLLGQMTLIDKQINMGSGKRGAKAERKKRYTKLLLMANKALVLLTPEVKRIEESLERLDILPSQKHKAIRLVQWLNDDIQTLLQVIKNCKARVMQGVDVPAKDKVPSISDPDAAFIVKGGREVIVGYKPQLGRSGKIGLVIALILPRGNAADSNQLLPLVNQTIARTKRVPNTVSTDDGYSSAHGRQEVLNLGVKVVSLNGSKGKHITPPGDWDDPEYKAARNIRSAVESLMYTLKHNNDFGTVCRRGQENVLAEMLEKVLAYNFCRMAACRRARNEQERMAA